MRRHYLDAVVTFAIAGRIGFFFSLSLLPLSLSLCINHSIVKRNNNTTPSQIANLPFQFDFLASMNFYLLHQLKLCLVIAVVHSDGNKVS